MDKNIFWENSIWWRVKKGNCLKWYEVLIILSDIIKMIGPLKL